MRIFFATSGLIPGYGWFISTIGQTWIDINLEMVEKEGDWNDIINKISNPKQWGR